MHFDEIPQLTKQSPYQVNMNLDYLPRWIKEQESDLNLQLNPDFQRGHVWTETQQIKYVEYLLRGGQSGRDLYFNCPHWVSCSPSGYSDFVCVDGLQRITAITRFIQNEIPAFGTLYKDFEGSLRLTQTVVVHINTLKSRSQVITWYIEMNSAGTPHTPEELERVKKLLE